MEEPLCTSQIFGRIFRAGTHPINGCNSDIGALTLMLGSGWIKIASKEEIIRIKDCRQTDSQEEASRFLMVSRVTKSELIYRLQGKNMDDIITFVENVKS
jgi:hypothetical protein